MENFYIYRIASVEKYESRYSKVYSVKLEEESQTCSRQGHTTITCKVFVKQRSH